MGHHKEMSTTQLHESVQDTCKVMMRSLSLDWLEWASYIGTPIWGIPFLRPRSHSVTPVSACSRGSVAKVDSATTHLMKHTHSNQCSVFKGILNTRTLKKSVSDEIRVASLVFVVQSDSTSFHKQCCFTYTCSCPFIFSVHCDRSQLEADISGFSFVEVNQGNKGCNQDWVLRTP